MQRQLFIRTVVVLVLLALTLGGGEATARGRKKKNMKTTEIAAPAQGRRISLTLDLSELRDSIEAVQRRSERELLAEFADSDRVAYARLVERMNFLTRMRPPLSQSSGSYLGDLAVDMAREHLGKPYVWGAEGPENFDCSGFMMFVFRQVGVRLPRTSRDQYRMGEPVEIPDLRKGDLVFWSGRRGSVGATIGHVGMVCDVDYERGLFYFIHSSSGKHGVGISRSDEKYFLLHYKGARRVIPLDK